MRKLLLSVFMLTAFLSCTDNQRARTFGGTENVKLQPNEKFVNIAWKGDDLWILVQDTTTGIYYAREKSSFGVMEGVVVIQK